MLDFNWELSRTLILQQNASAYMEKDKISLSLLTALDAKVMARLSARFSYSTAYESQVQLAEESFDTLRKSRWCTICDCSYPSTRIR
ncbi:MAG: DUF481 domain-containing protein [Alphaproteobacteria bacterium]|nr:DUF481 domain-containing protein [Alphaproteobacteria bacterium]